jgi:putative ABC transport system permease protein
MIALKNFLHTLRRYKAATLLNILGLAVAFAAFYILMVQVRFDLNFDRSYPKAECIYQIALPQFYEEGKGYSSFIPRPDGEKAIAASPHIRQGGCKNIMGMSETSLYDPEQGPSAGLNRHPVYQISHGLLEVFGFRCIEGSFARFEEPNTVILSQKTARALYGGKSAVGRSLVFNDDSRHPREVIAVYEDFPDNSSVHNGAITDIGEHFLNRTSNWMYNYLVKLDSPDHMEETRQAIIAGLKTLRPDVKAEVFEKVRLVQLHELYFSPEFQSMFRGNRATVYSLLTIAILIVVIAMINFINFSVALVPLRIRNINTQKVLGRPTPALRCDTVLEAAGTALISFLLAIIISIIGVFGLVIFDTQYRRGEIGVRKVFGATVGEILAMFNKTYVRIIAVCFVIAAPIAYYEVSLWLKNFASRTPVHIWVFAAALLIVLSITLLTVTLQSYKAATENPANAVKSE